MNDQITPLISLIIPVYNAKETLDKCMSYALSQSYPNYEILLVDDGSSDGSETLCDELAENNSIVRVIHHERNRGLSVARNTGIANSTGCYIAFMDADDAVCKDYLSRLYELCQEYDAPIAACNHNIVRGSNVVPRFQGNGSSVCLTQEVICENILYQKVPDVSAWGKLYKRSVLDGVVYPDGKIYEDTACIAEIVLNIDKIAFTYEPLYDYIISANTLSHGKYTPQRWEYIEAVDHMTGLIEKRYPKMKRACICRRVFAALSVRRYFVADSDADCVAKKKLESYIRKNASAVLFNRNTPCRDKIAVASLLIHSKLYDLLWRIYDKRRN